MLTARWPAVAALEKRPVPVTDVRAEVTGCSVGKSISHKQLASTGRFNVNEAVIVDSVCTVVTESALVIAAVVIVAHPVT